jgi:hypothetical protein
MLLACTAGPAGNCMSGIGVNSTGGAGGNIAGGGGLGAGGVDGDVSDKLTPRPSDRPIDVYGTDCSDTPRFQLLSNCELAIAGASASIGCIGGGSTIGGAGRGVGTTM